MEKLAMITRICWSRYTPNLVNAKNVVLHIGDEIDYKLLDGKVIEAKIASDYSIHENGACGYEGYLEDSPELVFLDELRIVNWQGTCDTMSDLEKALKSS